MTISSINKTGVRMRVKYYYSACVSITTPDVSILCDPWFTDGIYDGSWYQFPKLDKPLERVDKYDLIYISHIHPDHYDPVFLREYLNRHPDARIIAKEKFLINALKREGFPLYEGRNEIFNTGFEIFFNDTGSASDIDTALVVKWKDKSIVNMNDNAFNEKQIAEIKEYVGKPNVALLSYCGAGPYPQTYYKDVDILARLAEEKKQKFFGRYKEMDRALGAKINIPFAGQYVLGGKLAHLNEFRGVPDAIEVTEFDNKAIVLGECEELEIDNHSPASLMESCRFEPYDGLQDHVDTIKQYYFDYENEILPAILKKVPFERLLRKAYERAMKANEYKGSDYYIIIKLLKGFFVCNINSNMERCVYVELLSALPDDAAYSLIEIDMRYLFGLLTGIYHWNNAEVGSHFKTTRVPDVFNRDVQRFLNFFYV